MSVATDPAKRKATVLHQLVRGWTETTIVFQHLVVRVLENDGCAEAPSQRRASWRRADSDMIKRITMCQV